MSTKSVRILASMLCFGLLISMYQNCAKGFDTDGKMAELSSLEHSAPHVTLNSINQTPNSDLEFIVHEESIPPTASYQWSYKLNGNTSGCSVISQTASSRFILNCANPGKLEVFVKITDGLTDIPIQNYSTIIQSVSSATPSLRASYTIPLGTGRGQWNSPTSPIEVFVGQTLIITNGDNINHQLHTGGKPCSHGNSFASGTTFNCNISSAYNSATDGAIYDHNVGSSARFYVVAYDGTQLYNSNCMSCHGPLTSSNKKNATIAQIQSAIFNQNDMKMRTSLTNLKAKQLEAIAYVLSR